MHLHWFSGEQKLICTVKEQKLMCTVKMQKTLSEHADIKQILLCNYAFKNVIKYA